MMTTSTSDNPAAVWEKPRAQNPRRRQTSGFSMLELDRAGISESRALALGLLLDGTRRTALRRNIHLLKNLKN